MREKWIATILLLFLLFKGIGDILSLFLFEGYDEIGHYSLLRQTYDEGYPITAPAYLDQAILDFRVFAPSPNVTLTPYDARKGISYQTFFSSDVFQSSYNKFRLEGGMLEPFKPSNVENWQTQHPPLYYVLFSTVMHFVKGLSLEVQVMCLRVASFLLALIGFWIGLAASMRATEKGFHPYLLLTGFAYPLFAPQFFPEFARMGNDSLCLLLVGLFWACFLWWWREPLRRTPLVLLGLILGAGLMTKALFIPLAASFLLFAAVVYVRQKVKPAASALALFVLPLLPAIGWYFFKSAETGAAIGHLEYAMAGAGQGIVSAFWHNVSATNLLQAIVYIPWTFVWSGNASAGLLHELIYYPVILFALWLFIRIIRNARKEPSGPLWFVVLAVLALLIGLLHHAFVCLALVANGATPGWYLHVLSPLLVFGIAHSVRAVLRFVVGRVLFWGLLAYSFFFSLLTFWAEKAYFAACAVAHEDKVLSFTQPWICLSDISGVAARLGQIVWPEWALVFYVLSFFCLSGGMALIPHKNKENT